MLIICILQGCLHEFFNELRDQNTRFSDGQPVPATMFTFTSEEMALAPEILNQLIPEHYKSIPQVANSANTLK